MPIVDGRMARMALLLIAGIVALYGCGSAKPRPGDLVGPETRVLLQTGIRDGIAVLGQRSSGDLVLGLWSSNGERETFGRQGSQSAPVVGWLKGTAVVAGAVQSDRARSVELLTEQGTMMKGTLRGGAFILNWSSPSVPRRFLLRVLDQRGDELLRWPPASAVPAA